MELSFWIQFVSWTRMNIERPSTNHRSSMVGIRCKARGEPLRSQRRTICSNLGHQFQPHPSCLDVSINSWLNAANPISERSPTERKRRAFLDHYLCRGGYLKRAAGYCSCRCLYNLMECALKERNSKYNNCAFSINCLLENFDRFTTAILRSD